MVRPGQDVADAQPTVVAQDVESRGLRRNDVATRIGAQHGLDKSPIDEPDPQQGVSLALAEPGDADLASDEAAGPAALPVTLSALKTFSSMLRNANAAPPTANELFRNPRRPMFFAINLSPLNTFSLLSEFVFSHTQ